VKEDQRNLNEEELLDILFITTTAVKIHGEQIDDLSQRIKTLESLMEIKK